MYVYIFLATVDVIYFIIKVTASSEDEASDVQKSSQVDLSY